MTIRCALAVLTLAIGGFLAVAGLQIQLDALDGRLSRVEVELSGYE